MSVEFLRIRYKHAGYVDANSYSGGPVHSS